MRPDFRPVHAAAALAAAAAGLFLLAGTGEDVPAPAGLALERGATDRLSADGSPEPIAPAPDLAAGRPPERTVLAPGRRTRPSPAEAAPAGVETAPASPRPAGRELARPAAPRFEDLAVPDRIATRRARLQPPPPTPGAAEGRAESLEPPPDTPGAELGIATSGPVPPAAEADLGPEGLQRLLEDGQAWRLPEGYLAAGTR